jgi:hypothetical protein
MIEVFIPFCLVLVFFLVLIWSKENLANLIFKIGLAALFIIGLTGYVEFLQHKDCWRECRIPQQLETSEHNQE